MNGSVLLFDQELTGEYLSVTMHIWLLTCRSSRTFKMVYQSTADYNETVKFLRG
jgi:hypothetical protein